MTDGLRQLERIARKQAALATDTRTEAALHEMDEEYRAGAERLELMPRRSTNTEVDENPGASLVFTHDANKEESQGQEGNGFLEAGSRSCHAADDAE